MPNWKKIIVSGSSANLQNLNVDNSLTSSFLRVGELTYPTTSGSQGDYLTTDVSGNIVYGNPLSGSNSGSFSGSFEGDGSKLTGITVVQATTLESTFTNTTSVTTVHNLDTKNIQVTVYDSNDYVIIPASIHVDNSTTATVTFDFPTSGKIVFTKGGHIVSGSVPVESVSTVVDTFTNQSSVNINHNFGTKNIIVSTYDSNDYQIIPASVQSVDIDNVILTFDNATTGYAVVVKGGHLVSGSAELFTHREVISGNTNYTINHNLNEDYPIVQVYDSNKAQVIPASIISTDIDNIDVTFDSTFTGTVVVKK